MLEKKLMMLTKMSDLGKSQFGIQNGTIFSRISGFRA